MYYSFEAGVHREAEVQEAGLSGRERKPDLVAVLVVRQQGSGLDLWFRISLLDAYSFRGFGISARFLG